MADVKIPIEKFCELEGKNPRQVRRLYTKYPKLKCKVVGEKSTRVNVTYWEKIKQTA
jgi:hypothetical protein